MTSHLAPACSVRRRWLWRVFRAIWGTWPRTHPCGGGHIRQCAALHEAIRATRFGGTVCMGSCNGRDSAGLYLGDEFHDNRLNLIAVRAETLPGRDAPVRDLQRLVDRALAWLASGRIRTEGITSPIVPFAEAAEAYRALDERLQDSITLGIRF